MAKIGIIGGSGLYKIEGLQETKWVKVQTPFGEPSDEYLTGKLQGQEVAFLPRHGRGHRVMPTELNYRANIYGMKKLGVERIIAVSTVGSLKEKIRPLDIMIPDQFVDRTNQARKVTFFGEGITGHIVFANPTCSVLSQILYEAAKDVGATVHLGGTYINMEGPAFSTRAESNLYRQWGMDVIGMTIMPEARLAREAEICFATLALVTDYDCWRQVQGEQEVNIELVIQNLSKMVEVVKGLLNTALPKLPAERKCSCATALKDAIITDRNLIPEHVRERLDLIVGKYI